MMSVLTDEYKLRIVEAIKDQSFKFKSQSAQASTLGISAAQFSRIVNGDIEKVISEDKWGQIASKYNVPTEANAFVWHTAYTQVYHTIYKQLEACQDESISSMFCDIADIGKSYTAKDYVSRHRNAILVDCSQYKSRTALVRAIAREFGIDWQGSPRIVKKDLVQYMRSMNKPIVILDEFGDLDYPAYLEVKALWNATEWRCGWYMMGADGLEAKFDRSRELKKVGFAELFSRLGSRYQRVTPPDAETRKHFLLKEIAHILKVNKSTHTPLEMYAKTGGSLRRLYIEIRKENRKIKNINVEVEA
jgi:hypothetical protein